MLFRAFAVDVASDVSRVRSEQFGSVSVRRKSPKFLK